MNAEKEILMQIVKSNLYYDSEYDGRMYSYCRYCDAGGERHDEDCIYVKAFDIVKEEIYVNEKKKLLEKLEKDFQEKARESQSLFKRVLRNKLKRMQTVYVNCEKCGKKVSQEGMQDHQSSMACKTKSINDNAKRKCLYCKCGIDDMHQNAKFCSNKGVGNCKDRYYNKLYKR